ncbi:MAG: endonuclease [Sphingobacteriales bacterium]|nr:endonuclease [Sphingobacteriales bacterium]
MSIKHTSKSIIFLIFSFSILSLFYSCRVFHAKQPADNNMVSDRNGLIVMFYNVENLFDTINDPLTNDEEFLPEGANKWNSYRYYDKLQKLSKAMIAVGGWSPPELIGLEEIENQRVLEDLIRLTPLKNAGYEIIHKESPDYRGIDVALLYRKKFFKPIYYEFIQVKNVSDTSFRTREILFAKGIVNKKDTLHIFVNHWPSRRGGQTESEGNRQLAAKKLKEKVDSVFEKTPEAYIIIGGDFNDEPSNISISQTLGARLDSNDIKASGLYNLFGYSEAKGKGSYKFRLEWDQIDQIIVSSAFFNDKGNLFISKSGGKIFSEDWLMEEDTKYQGKKPWRTYNDTHYNGGYSDHLPVFTEILIK